MSRLDEPEYVTVTIIVEGDEYRSTFAMVRRAIDVCFEEEVDDYPYVALRQWDAPPRQQKLHLGSGFYEVRVERIPVDTEEHIERGAE